MLFEHWTIIYDRSTKCCITYIYDNITTYRQYIYINKSYNIVSKGDGMQFLGIMLWESPLGCAHLQSQFQCRIIPQSHSRSLFPTTWFPNQSTKHMPVRMQISSLSQGHWLPRVNRTMHDRGCTDPSILNILLHALNNCIINVDRWRHYWRYYHCAVHHHDGTQCQWPRWPSLTIRSRARSLETGGDHNWYNSFCESDSVSLNTSVKHFGSRTTIQGTLNRHKQRQKPITNAEGTHYTFSIR